MDTTILSTQFTFYVNSEKNVGQCVCKWEGSDDMRQGCRPLTSDPFSSTASCQQLVTKEPCMSQQLDFKQALLMSQITVWIKQFVNTHFVLTFMLKRKVDFQKSHIIDVWLMFGMIKAFDQTNGNGEIWPSKR